MLQHLLYTHNIVLFVAHEDALPLIPPSPLLRKGTFDDDYRRAKKVSSFFGKWVINLPLFENGVAPLSHEDP